MGKSVVKLSHLAIPCSCKGAASFDELMIPLDIFNSSLQCFVLYLSCSLLIFISVASVLLPFFPVVCLQSPLPQILHVLKQIYWQTFGLEAQVVLGSSDG